MPMFNVFEREDLPDFRIVQRAEHRFYPERWSAQTCTYLPEMNETHDAIIYATNLSATWVYIWNKYILQPALPGMEI